MGHNIEHRTKKGKEILCILGAGAGAGAAAETAAAAHSTRIYSPPISAGGTECLVTLYCTLDLVYFTLFTLCTVTLQFTIITVHSLISHIFIVIH